MGVDLNWQMLTDAGQNFGNALTQAASTIHDRRKESDDRAATANYLANPNDPAAFQAAVRRNPAQALQIQDHHLEAARNLRTEHQQQLDYIGQLLTQPNGQPITAEQYPQALALAHGAGIDTTGWETYDPARVGQVVELHQRLHPVAPVSVGEGARLVNPQTGAEVAAGNPRPPRYYPVQPGGTLVRDPSYQDPGVAQLAPASPAAGTGDVIAVNPATGHRLRLNPQTQQWEPLADTPDLQNWNRGGAAQPNAPGTFPGR